LFSVNLIVFHSFATWHVKKVSHVGSGHKPGIKLWHHMLYCLAQWQTGHIFKLSV